MWLLLALSPVCGESFSFQGPRLAKEVVSRPAWAGLVVSAVAQVHTPHLPAVCSSSLLRTAQVVRSMLN